MPGSRSSDCREPEKEWKPEIELRTEQNRNREQPRIERTEDRKNRKQNNIETGPLAYTVTIYHVQHDGQITERAGGLFLWIVE